MNEFEALEQPRPEFQGEWAPNETDGRMEAQFPTHKKVTVFVLWFA